VSSRSAVAHSFAGDRGRYALVASKPTSTGGVVPGAENGKGRNTANCKGLTNFETASRQRVHRPLGNDVRIDGRRLHARHVHLNRLQRDTAAPGRPSRATAAPSRAGASHGRPECQTNLARETWKRVVGSSTLYRWRSCGNRNPYSAVPDSWVRHGEGSKSVRRRGTNDYGFDFDAFFVPSGSCGRQSKQKVTPVVSAN
jgi:hypothetical protein